MEVTLEALNTQIEIQKMYRDDKFAAKLKELQAKSKFIQDAQKALDERERTLKQREKLCEVITASQTAFNEEKAEAEAKNLEDSQHNQSVKDDLAKQVAGVKKTRDDANRTKANIESLMKSTTVKLIEADAKLKRAVQAEEAAEQNRNAYTKRLADLGLKAA